MKQCPQHPSILHVTDDDYEAAVKICREWGIVGISRLQRHFRWAYTYASCIAHIMVTTGVCYPEPDLNYQWKMKPKGYISTQSHKPTPEDQREGLKAKYQILHADGSSCDPAAKYFVLRLDVHKDCHYRHIAACQEAALIYAEEIAMELPALARDLRDIVERERMPGSPGSEPRND